MLKRSQIIRFLDKFGGAPLLFMFTSEDETLI